jgi:hypothetical protein
MALKATVHTDKDGLTAPIAFVNLPTLAAFLAGMPGVNQQQWNPRKQALVFQELPQLVESSIAVSGSLLLANPGLLANAFQVFDGNRPLRVLGKINQPPTDTVIHILLKPGLSPGKLFEPALGGPGSYRLQIVPAALIPPPFLLYLVRSLDDTIAGDHDIVDPHVDTDNIIYFLFWLFFNFTGRIQVELTFDAAEIRLTSLGFQQAVLVCPAGVGDLQSSSQRPDGDITLVCVPLQNAIIVSDCSLVGKLPFLLPVKFISIGHLADRSDNHLGRQLVMLSNVVVDQLVDIVLLESLLIPGHAADGVAGPVGFLERIQQDLLFICCAEQFDLGGEFHRTIVLQIQDFIFISHKAESPLVLSLSK